MIFTYVMAEWEGITHDARILNETLKEPQIHGFPVPPEGMVILIYAYIFGIRLWSILLNIVLVHFLLLQQINITCVMPPTLIQGIHVSLQRCALLV